MPIGFETETGYYDDKGMFHPNVGLIPSGTFLPGITQITPVQINPSLPYNPGFSSQLWGFGQEVSIPALPKLNLPSGSNLIGGLIGGAAGSAFNVTLAPLALLLGGALIFRKDISRIVRKIV